MFRLACVVLLAAALAAVARADADDKGDLGTVIGIDLGTTYSWFV
jgi:molecular chaperone DnaK (HSP70)